MSNNELSVAKVIEQLAADFDVAGLTYGHGTDNAADEAAWLVFSRLGLSFDADETVYDIPVTSESMQDIRALADRRISERTPMAYLLNEAFFCGLEFYVDERVLVPRSPIAELIVEGFSPWLDPERVGRIADIGTGSGCIAIACAYAFPEATVDAVDISSDALDVTRLNTEKHDLQQRVRAVESDLLANLDEEYDLIVSNPPYVDQQDMDALTAEFRHEPELGLAAGEDGLDCVHHILKDAHRCLKEGGILVCEVGNCQPALEKAYPDLPFVWLSFELGGEGVFLLTKEDLPGKDSVR